MPKEVDRGRETSLPKPERDTGISSTGASNPLIVALRVVFGPLVAQSTRWPPLLAYGLPGIVAVLLIALLRPAVPGNLVWLLMVVILAPLVGYIVTDFIARAQSKSHADSEQRSQPPWARIDNPGPRQIVERTIDCSGLAAGVPHDMHLWLAVEAGGLIWPKETEVHVERDGRWKGVIFEDGSTKRFSVSLLMADQQADRCIREWLDAGRPTGTYSELKGIPGTNRIARVDGLRLKMARRDR